MSNNPSQRLGGRVAIVVALCEPNSVRAQYHNELLASLDAPAVPVYQPSEFGEMLKKERVDVVVITCVDALHDGYIIPALEAGVRVLTEKPMTTDAEKCRKILETVQRTGRHLTVTFNYRYNPVHELVKRTIAEGKIGRVLSVHFEWLLDTVHGADYFRRWHRQKSNSGGLMVHKAGHHFDLVNWWIDAEPETVAGFGKLAFYGEEAGKKHGWAKEYERARGSEAAKADPFPFISNDMSVMTAYSPWEGYRVMFNGSQGRLELEVVESNTEMSGLIHGTQALPHVGDVSITLQKLWGKPEKLPVKVEHGSHGGGDARMLNVLFGPLPGQSEEVGDAAKQGANEKDGAMALAVGLLANESFRTGAFADVKSLQFPL
ncbi:oxidoreductase [Infundibulicybe gibba]|nr:oxidoreductase [Infundibulicybe gibba]